jgi:hypothetical protein
MIEAKSQAKIKDASSALLCATYDVGAWRRT